MSKRLVCGVGINDADYVVKPSNGKSCPFYIRWVSMIKRCYRHAYQQANPSYIGCKVVEEWKIFSNFKAWMEKQDWQGKHLDKDILIPGNKVYGPNTCVFVDRNTNIFVTEAGAIRGEWPIGVYWCDCAKKFRARCGNPFTGECEHLGRFTCPNEAHRAWLKRKQELAILLAAEQTDERVAKAIIDRYMNYGGTND